MTDYPETINSEEQLEELLSRPTEAVVELFRKLEGDLAVLGVAGKIGPSLARMARRACDAAGVSRRVLGVSRFSDPRERERLEAHGVETIAGDLLDPAFVAGLPQVRNALFLAGMKFGSEANLALTWAMNAYVPALVADHYRASRVVAFSTGCVYPLVAVSSGGSTERDRPVAVGEYAQSCLGRERMFEYGSARYGTPAALLRLNYAAELRYGVLVDLASKVAGGEPVDLSMGYFNVIWQGDANAAALLSLAQCGSPATVLNLTGPETLSAREVALDFGRLLGKRPMFVGAEAPTALLSDASLAHRLFGKPRVSPDQMMRWTAGWVGGGKRLLNKRTHYEVRDGKY
jgi:hypothetical protein